MDLSSASDFFGPLARYKSTAVVLSIGAACVLANGILSKRAVRGKKKPSSWNWNEEIVVVTGGSGGIGRELVDGFARRGVTVVSLDVKPAPPAVTDIVADIAKQKTRGRTYHYQVDVTSREAVRDVGRRIRDEVGGDPTVLINNAGLAVGRPLLDGDEQTVRAVFGVNLLAHFWTAHEFLPAMIARDHGHVISMASVASYVTLASNVEYSCTKAGVQAFHEGLGQDLRHRYGAKSVLTSIVFPYWVKTPLIRNLTSHPSFNAPLMSPNYVAEMIIRHVMRGEHGGEIYLPWYARLLTGVRGWPLWMQEMLRDSMAGFLRDTTF